MALLGKPGTEKVNRLMSSEFQLKLAFLSFPIFGPTVSGTLDSKGVTKELKSVFYPITTLIANLDQHDQDYDMVADAWDNCPNLANTSQGSSDCSMVVSQLSNTSGLETTAPRFSAGIDNYSAAVRYHYVGMDPAGPPTIVFNGNLTEGTVLNQMPRSADGNPLRLEIVNEGKVSFLAATCEANQYWPTTIACSVAAKDLATVIGKTEQEVIDIFTKYEDENYKVAIRSGTNLSCTGCSGPLLTPKQWKGPEVNNTIKAPDNSDANKFKLKKMIPLK